MSVFITPIEWPLYVDTENAMCNGLIFFFHFFSSCDDYNCLLKWLQWFRVTPWILRNLTADSYLSPEEPIENTIFR